METILLIEDDEGLNRGICFSLEKDGYRILTAKSLSEGRTLFDTAVVDLVLLDINLPDGDGLDFCREIREKFTLPVIFLTARDLETDEIIGLEVGADDYITKPFSLSVLKVRISALLRRITRYREGEKQPRMSWLISSNIRLCKDNHQVYKNGEAVDLSATEFKILKLFMENSKRLLLKEQILEAVWDSEANFVEENTLSVNIRRLRKKLEEDASQPKLIKTVHGMGYLWAEGLVKYED